jgi:hypothetical protein
LTDGAEDEFFTMKKPNLKYRLAEFSAKSEAKMHELGILTKNRPQYDESGRFVGMKGELNPVGATMAGAGLAGTGVGGYMGHRAIQGAFGNQGIESYKQAGRYAANEAKHYTKAGLGGAADGLSKVGAKGGALRNTFAKLHRIVRGFR